MPPQITDDEASDISEKVEVLKKKAQKKTDPKAKTSKKIEPEPEDAEESEDDDDDNEIAEDVYVVEDIKDHIINDNGQLLFEVAWEGYEKKSDRTWEPEGNLMESAIDILNAYLTKVGGREALMEAYKEKKRLALEKKSKKRAHTSDGGANGPKKAKKNGVHPGSTSPPASLKKREFKPPSGSWEEEVVGIDACEGNEGSVVVYITWKTGDKTQHPLSQVYKRCPQRMLKFYEQHLVFKKTDD